MKKTALKSLALKAVSVAIVAVSMANVANAADWTPYLKRIQEGCDITEGSYGVVELSDMLHGDISIPDHLRSDVVSRDVNAIYFKNATAFGYPMTKFSWHPANGDFNGHVYSVHFANSDFMKLLPSFFFVPNSVGISAGLNIKEDYDFDRLVPVDDTNFEIITLPNGVTYKKYDSRFASTDNGYYSLSENIRVLVFDKDTKTISCQGTGYE